MLRDNKISHSEGVRPCQKRQASPLPKTPTLLRRPVRKGNTNSADYASFFHFIVVSAGQGDVPVAGEHSTAPREPYPKKLPPLG